MWICLCINFLHSLCKAESGRNRTKSQSGFSAIHTAVGLKEVKKAKWRRVYRDDLITEMLFLHCHINELGCVSGQDILLYCSGEGKGHWPGYTVWKISMDNQTCWIEQQIDWQLKQFAYTVCMSVMYIQKLQQYNEQVTTFCAKLLLNLFQTILVVHKFLPYISSFQ